MARRRLSEFSAGQRFMEETKHRNLAGPSDQQVGRASPPLEFPGRGGEAIALVSPEYLADPQWGVRSLFEGRRSVRRYADSALSQGELSYLLWATQGVQEVLGSGVGTLRTAPSAGARHALETTVLANAVDGLTPGLYRYLALSHTLVSQGGGPHAGVEVTHACYDQLFIAESAATFIWWAAPYRMTWRYGERGYRYLHLDAGHVCQNLYLAAESLGCGACAVAAFDDDALNGILGLDGRDGFAIYLASVGRKAGG